VKLQQVKTDYEEHDGMFEKKSEGGIILEHKARAEINREHRGTQEARVVAIGPCAYADYGDGTPWCRPGDLVMICRYSGDDLDDIEDGEIYRVINDKDVMSVYEGE
jgi:co-chaperonin GroES (HSP10)